MELSEKLKAKLTETKNEPNTLKWMDLLQQIGALVIDHQDAIIAALDSSEHKAKCVQFAEDVKRLKKSGSVRFMASGTGGILCQCILYRTTTPDADERDTVKGRGDDIYTAARKAVEALTKGEGA